MKTKLLLLILFISSITYAQVPGDYQLRYDFTGGSLQNLGSSGANLVRTSGSGTISQTDHYGTNNNAIRVNGDEYSGGSLAATNNLTISFWMKGGGPDGTSQRILQLIDSSGSGVYIENVNGDRLKIHIEIGTTVLTTTDVRSDVYDGEWHNITLTVQLNGYYYSNLYVDGAAVSTTSSLNLASGPDFINSSAQFKITPISSLKFYDSIDDISIFSRALSASEVFALYNQSENTGSNLSRYYVDHTATGSGDGSSWANAFVGLQQALVNAGSDDEIWIASGTYKPAVASRSTYFHITQPNLSIYGGFAGTETSIEDRVLGANETKLSGDLLGNDVNVTGFVNNYGNTTRNGDNSYRIIAIQAAGENLLLDGLTISDAHTNVDGTTIGGAIYKDDAVNNLTLVNCIIKDNVSRNFSAGISAEFDLANTISTRGSLVVDRCQFVNNMSRGGSGMYSIIRGNTYVDYIITNSVFDKNITSDLSSALKAVSGSSMWLRSAGAGSDASIRIYNNTYVNNIDNGTQYATDDSFRSTLAIAKNGTFSNNIVGSVANCIFWNNTGESGLTRAISDLWENPIASLKVYYSLDPLNFVEGSITSSIATETTSPLFVDISNGDYSLTANSPAVNTGGNSYTLGAMDLLGNQRVYSANVDMGAYEYDTVSLGVNDFSIAENEVKLYPNPTTTVLNIKMTSSLKQATVYSVLGRKVLETTSKTIQTSNLKTGLYLIKIEDENGSISTKRFIKQ
ncbi:T9SS type A sorting domain-containing protein [Lacinutrix undariae]